MGDFPGLDEERRKGRRTKKRQKNEEKAEGRRQKAERCSPTLPLPPSHSPPLQTP
ncbi:MAG: hypothetical protein F6K30_04240 [Cyanothece sp. SIO2G6]|nr:hypothetical protein [Cyanothece sp. SIO2G6]